MHRPASQVAEELAACIRCNECLVACPALAAPIKIETLNRQTLDGPVSQEVMRFAQGCYQCGACVPVCPAGLHRDTMMMWLKMRLLRSSVARDDNLSEDARDGDTDQEDFYPPAGGRRLARGRPDARAPQSWAARGWYDE